MKIILNHSICDSTAFNWLKDSGFRYGYGCFETMLCFNGTIPLIDMHYDRLKSSLASIHIPLTTQKKEFIDQIKALFLAVDNQQATMTCRIYVSGGNIQPLPQFDIKHNTIITLDPLIESPIKHSYEFKRVTPSEFFRLKSMNYAHHLIELSQSASWPIYIDHENAVIDSSIFAVGIVVSDRIIFAKHNDQLPSVSRQFLLQNNDLYSHKLIKKMDIDNATAVFGCNAVKGVFSLRGDSTQVAKLHDVWKSNLALLTC